MYLCQEKQQKHTIMVSIIMGSTSDLPVMEKAAAFLDQMEIPFEMNALSAHRTPSEVEQFATGAQARGVRVIIAGRHSSKYHDTSYRSPHQGHARRPRCHAQHNTDAPRNPRCHRRRERSTQCRYPRSRNACPVRPRPVQKAAFLQGKPEAENSQCKPGTIAS